MDGVRIAQMRKDNITNATNLLLKKYRIVTSQAGIDLEHYKNNHVAFFLAREINTNVYDGFMRGDYASPHNALLNTITFIFRMFEDLDKAPIYKGAIEDIFYDTIRNQGGDTSDISKDYRPYKFALHEIYLILGFLFELDGRTFDAIECLYFSAIVMGQLQINRIKHISQKRHSSQMAHAKHSKDPKQQAKKEIKEEYLEWQAMPEKEHKAKYRSAAKFASVMRDTHTDKKSGLPYFDNPRKIEQWCTKWKKELKNTHPA